jgi:phosphoribosylformimino-5-aminoimidazole carboxamide ribotide isomerase
MIVVPAIDVRQGKVVRLMQGLLNRETVYDGDPAEMARRWETEGARRLHLVDLEAAIQNQPQPDVIESVIRAVKIPVEVGGGLRTFELAERYRQAGAERVIFGTAAVSQPELVQRAVVAWPEAVAVALDAVNGKVATAGWVETSDVDALALASRIKSWGVLRLQYTDTQRDGTFDGPNVAGIAQVARASGLRITAAGGVATLDDIEQLRALEALGVDEVIVGKALYERRFTLQQATALGGGHA